MAAPGRGLLFKNEESLSTELHINVDQAGPISNKTSTTRYITCF